MMEYKISRELRDGKTTKVVVNFYEGDMVPQKRIDGSEDIVFGNRNRVRSQEFTFEGDLTKEEVCKFLDTELASICEEKGHEAVAVQATVEVSEKLAPSKFSLEVVADAKEVPQPSIVSFMADSPNEPAI
jgi:hypothetical protein